MIKSLNALIPVEHILCKSFDCLSVFAITQGCFSLMYLFAKSAELIIRRTALLYSKRSYSSVIDSRFDMISSINSGLSRVSASLPSKLLFIKPAQRLAMFASFPTRSELTFCTKSSRFKSKSSTPDDNFAAK